MMAQQALNPQVISQQEQEVLTINPAFIDIQPKHNYEDGVTYFEVSYCDIQIGFYWRDGWAEDWVASETGHSFSRHQEQQEAVNRLVEAFLKSLR